MTYTYCEVIITVNLVNIHHFIQILKKKKEEKMFSSFQ